MKRLTKKQLMRFLRDWVKPIAVVVIVACTFRSAIADWNDVPTPSMNPTILEGDRIFVNKLAYGLRLPFTPWRLWEWSGPARGDIVIFFSPDENIRMVKRVVGVPGDVLALRNNGLYVNGRPAAYGPLEASMIEQLDADKRRGRVFACEMIEGQRHPIMLTPGRRTRSSFSMLTVPAGQYFCMGDNRDNSRDSRWFGLVPRERIVGRTAWVAASFDPSRWYWPRWDRFLKRLP